MKAGRIIVIPSRDDRPYFFTAEPSRSVAEVLTSIVSEKALARSTARDRPLEAPA